LTRAFCEPDQPAGLQGGTRYTELEGVLPGLGQNLHARDSNLRPAATAERRPPATARAGRPFGGIVVTYTWQNSACLHRARQAQGEVVGASSSSGNSK